MRYFRLFLAFAFLASFAAVRADIIAVSSIGAPTTDGTPVSKSAWVADKFTTGSNASFLTLTNVTIQFHSSTGTGGYFVSIYNDVLGAPGSALATLTGSTNPNTTGNFTYTPSSPITLDASTSYWLVEGSTSSTNLYQPMYVTTNTPFTGHGWTITGNYYVSTNVVNVPTWGLLHTDGPTQYNISVAFVPEPTTYALMAGAVGLGAVLVLRKRNGNNAVSATL